MRFFKYTGLGNDFLIFDGRPFDPKTIQELTNRHFGIGADGILFVDTNAFSFSIYNADGLRAKMCGNGLRSVAQYLYDSGKVEKDSVFEIKSEVATHLCSVGENEVSCSLPRPILVQKDPYLVDAGAMHVVLFEKPDLEKAQLYRKNFNANVNFFFRKPLVNVPTESSDDISLGASFSPSLTHKELASGSEFPSDKNLAEISNYPVNQKLLENHVHTFEKGIEDFSQACGTGALSCFFILDVNELELVMRSKKPMRFYQEKNCIWMVAKCQKVFEGTVEKACLERIFMR